MTIVGLAYEKRSRPYLASPNTDVVQFSIRIFEIQVTSTQIVYSIT